MLLVNFHFILFIKIKKCRDFRSISPTRGGQGHPKLWTDEELNSSFGADDDDLHTDRSTPRPETDGTRDTRDRSSPSAHATSLKHANPNSNPNSTLSKQSSLSFTTHPSSDSLTDDRPATHATVATAGHVILSASGSRSKVTFPQHKPGVMFPRSLIDGVEKFQEERRRLLPKCPNGLHVIEGPEYRYFVGIVDFLTQFDWRQKSAQYWKMVKYSCGDHSTKHPEVYRRRFVDFLTQRVR